MSQSCVNVVQIIRTDNLRCLRCTVFGADFSWLCVLFLHSTTPPNAPSMLLHRISFVRIQEAPSKKHTAKSKNTTGCPGFYQSWQPPERANQPRRKFPSSSKENIRLNRLEQELTRIERNRKNPDDVGDRARGHSFISVEWKISKIKRSKEYRNRRLMQRWYNR